MQKQMYKCPNVTINLSNARLNNKWCDLTIKVDGQKIHAHKHILSANLKYFETVLSDDSFQEIKSHVVKVEHVKAIDLEAFVTYAYTGEILLTDNNVLSLLEAANYFGEHGIKEACIEFLEKHMKADDAFRVYKLANTVDRPSLKNVAKQMILSHLKNCSQTDEYLNLDFESLKDILADGKSQPVKSQQTLFEGIMRWIMHAFDNRRLFLKELLDLIDLTKMTTDYLMKYLGSIADREDDYGIIKDIVFRHHTCTKRQQTQTDKYSRQTLMVLGNVGGKLQFRFFDFIEKKWSPLQKISEADGSIFSRCAVLNGKLYYINRNSGVNHLQVFDPITKQSMTLHSSSNILGNAAVCACSRFVYMCGGMKENYLVSDQVLRYDPQTNNFETLPPMESKRVGAAAIFYEGRLHVLGGEAGPSHILNSVEKYDSKTKKWMACRSMYEKRNGHGLAVLDGKLYACGGYNNNSVEVYDSETKSWQLVANMNNWRERVLVVVHENKLLAIGGSEDKMVEIYDPSKDQWYIDRQMSSGLQLSHPIGGLM